MEVLFSGFFCHGDKETRAFCQQTQNVQDSEKEDDITMFENQQKCLTFECFLLEYLLSHIIEFSRQNDQNCIDYLALKFKYICLKR